jgi:hypothetical protein
MKINLHSFEKGEGQIQKLRQKIKLPSTTQLQIALDPVHGLNELTRSLANLHPHKRSIAVLGAQPPPLAEVLKGFAGEGFAVQDLPISFMAPDEGALNAAWEKLKKDTLFVVGSLAEPLTGALYPWAWAKKPAEAKGIFTVTYVSKDAMGKALNPQGPWESQVIDPLWGEAHRLNLVLKGDRCQGDSLLWGTPEFSDEAIESLLNNLESTGSENPKLVKSFETQVAKSLGESARFLSPDVSRLFDRSVIFIVGVNGEALSHALKEDGFETFTGAACAWDSPHLNNWLPQCGISAEMVQGSLIIPVQALGQKEFQQRLLERVSALRKISGFQ